MRFGGLVGALVCAAKLGAQSSAPWLDEVGVGTERELYLRVLGLSDRTIRSASFERPFPTRDSLGVWTRISSATALRITRPSAELSFNSAFPWQTSNRGEWEGRGLNLVAGAGVAFSRGVISARLEPAVFLSQNAAFRLENPSVGFANALTPNTVDEPQRFGTKPYDALDAGESFIRVSAWKLSASFSNERLFWGPGVRHSLLLSSAAPRFRHLSFESSTPLWTPIGSFSGQVIYGRLDETAWAPPAPTPKRFASGFIASWIAPGLPLELGVARFYHRPWPTHFRINDLFAPLGALFYSANTNFTGGVTDNQLASLFFRARVPAIRTEFFGEFGRNDRSVDVRDVSLEPEHNAAWLIGFLQSFGSVPARDVWTVRVEVATAKVSAIQFVGRSQSTWYEHNPITQGHTQRGLILGTPLVDRSGGFELALDRWDERGRVGISIMQRQMPPDFGVGIPRDEAHTQWDFRTSALRFVGRCDLTLQAGVVADLNRFHNTDVGNVYLTMGWRGLRP